MYIAAAIVVIVMTLTSHRLAVADEGSCCRVRTRLLGLAFTAVFRIG